MSKEIYRSEPRYVVQFAEIIHMNTKETVITGWKFQYAFHDLADAQACADRHAEDVEYERVVDRG